jgi:hypothetical protein
MKHVLLHGMGLAYEPTRQYLVSLRATCQPPHTLAESRRLYYALLLYKYRDQESTPEDLYVLARRFIMDTLRGIPHDPTAYLARFEEWKSGMHASFVQDVIQHYVHVLHLKDTLETRETSSEWVPSYLALLDKIKAAAAALGFLPVLEHHVAELQAVRQSLVTDTMRRAYWDLIEQDIREARYATVAGQLLEVKGLLAGILPASEHPALHSRFDLPPLDTVDASVLVDLCRWVLTQLQEWDCAANRALYDREVATWEAAELEWPTFLRFSLELCTLLALDTHTRVAIYRTLAR